MKSAVFFERQCHSGCFCWKDKVTDQQAETKNLLEDTVE